ncbi:uncharacterized protein [Battus philenor]|uniref:uncharacterized protein isoform X1 n=1 Tax=Battus philenor TaxID=42288 RepID=UPI0035CFA22F
MTQRALFHRLGNHVLEEAQLLAEKKWIMEALTKVRNQRNCLQIERLHLESLKAQMKGETKVNIMVKKIEEENSNEPTQSAVNLMQSVPKYINQPDITLGVTDEEIFCNEQALDLMISNCIYANSQDSMSCNMEEDDDEEEDDDIMIDMNMLMNGNTK